MDYKLQYYLVTNASDTSIGGILFQILRAAPDIKAIDKLQSKVCINMFMLYHLTDIETWYTTTEKEALAVV